MTCSMCLEDENKNYIWDGFSCIDKDSLAKIVGGPEWTSCEEWEQHKVNLEACEIQTDCTGCLEANDSCHW